MKESSFNGLSLLLPAFIILKLCKAIDWSWWWVLSPAWIGVSIMLIVFLILVILEIGDK